MRSHKPSEFQPHSGRLAGQRLQATVVAVTMVIVSLVSALVLSPHFSSTETYRGMFQTLDEKKNTVLMLSAASVAASGALTFIPDDACTPIAERLSEISKDFVVVIAALLLEKYLLTTLGFAFFTLLVPLCCVLFAASRFLDRASPRRMTLEYVTLKLFVFGLALFLATPVSVMVTERIDKTYEDTINATVEAAQQTTETIATVSEETKRKDPENPLEFFQQRLEDITSAAQGAMNTVTDVVEWVRGLLNNFIEAFAVMMVTSVVIPTLVPVIMYLLFKVLFGQQPITIMHDVAPRTLPAPARDHDDAMRN